MKFLVIDTETTGLLKHPEAKSQPRIIEFAGVLCDEHGETIERHSQLVNPEVKLESVITKITGLTDSDLKGQPKFSEIVEDIRPLFEQADALVAHNLPFDSMVLALELARVNVSDWPWPSMNICTVQEFTEDYGKRPKMTELFEDTFGEPLKQSHRALDDVGNLVAICKELEIFHAASTSH